MNLTNSAKETDVTEPSIDKGAGPFSAFERLMAMRYLRARRKEAFISVIAGFSFVGIVLGVATLIIVMAVMNGFRTELLDRILGINGHVIVQPIDVPLDKYDALAQRLSGVEGVKFAIPLVEGQVLASGNVGAGTGTLVRGLTEEKLKTLSLVAENIRQGSLDAFEGDNGVAIGAIMARNLGLGLGDTLTLIAPEGDVTAFGTSPRVKGYPVSAIFEVGMSEYDASIVYMPLEEAQAYFNSDGQVQSIELYVDDPDSVGDMRAALEAAAQRPIYLTDWTQRNRSFFSALQVERNVMFVILALIILVAALNIISGLIMLVKDKGRDIAILRTMGASSSAILRIFIMTGSAIGIAGTFAGFILGVLFVQNIKAIQGFVNWISGTDVWDPTVRFLTDIPARMDSGETIAVLILALSLSFLATLFPAWRAAKLDPVEALRYE